MGKTYKNKIKEYKFYKEKYKNNFWCWDLETDYSLRKKKEKLRCKINRVENNLITNRIIKSCYGKYYI